MHLTVQPYDTENRILTLPKLWGGFWNHFDWDKAIADGMKTAGLDYSGSYGFVKTKMYTGIHHEVVPAKMALGCSDCHARSAVSCVRCHAGARGMNQPKYTRRVYPSYKPFLNFKELGYSDDPAMIGGRFYIQIGRGKPPA